MAYGYRARKSRDLGARRSSQRAINKYQREIGRKNREARRVAKAEAERAQSNQGWMGSLLTGLLSIAGMTGMGAIPLLLLGGLGGAGMGALGKHLKGQSPDLNTDLGEQLSVSELKKRGGKVTGGSIDQINQMLSQVQGQREGISENMMGYEDMMDSWLDPNEWFQKGGMLGGMGALGSWFKGTDAMDLGSIFKNKKLNLNPFTWGKGGTEQISRMDEILAWNKANPQPNKATGGISSNEVPSSSEFNYYFDEHSFDDFYKNKKGN